MPDLVHAIRGFAVIATFAISSPAQARLDSDSLFGLKNVVNVHLEFAPNEWKKLQPPSDTDWSFERALDGVIKDAQAGNHLHSKKSSRPGVAGYAGVDHQYGAANVTIDGDIVHEVGVRYKGNGTFFAGHKSGKYSFKIDFNEYHDKLKFRGLKKINLNNSAVDPSMLREALSYELFREAGLPAPRTGWAKVYLTVVGSDVQRKYQGLYLTVEQVDKRFLKRVYGSSDGLLVKPSTFGAFRYSGDDWSKYEAGYFPKTDPTPEQEQRMMEFAHLIYGANDAEFAARIEEFLDMDEFLSFLAMNVILANLDSFLSGSQNYYAYLEPSSNQIQLLPWDLDISFGAFEMLGTPESRRNLSLDRPQTGYGNNRLIERVLALPRQKQAYRARIEQLMDTTFAEEKVMARIDEVAQFLRPLIAEEGPDAVKRFDAEISASPTDSPHALKYFVRKRRESIERQLAGESAGEHLNWDGQVPPEVVVRWIAVGLVFLFALLLNAIAWIWSAIAGIRDSTKWGLLNLFLYPIAPIIFGVAVRKDMGRGAAIMTACSSVLFVAVLVTIVSLAR